MRIRVTITQEITLSKEMIVSNAEYKEMQGTRRKLLDVWGGDCAYASAESFGLDERNDLDDGRILDVDFKVLATKAAKPRRSKKAVG